MVEKFEKFFDWFGWPFVVGGVLMFLSFIVVCLWLVVMVIGQAVGFFVDFLLIILLAWAIGKVVIWLDKH